MNSKGVGVSEKFSFTQKNLSDEIGIDVRTMQNYKKLTELIPELEDLVDTGSFTRFMDGGIQIKTDENKISIKLDIEEKDNSEILFTVQDIYNPMIYLQAYNEDKELSECVVCGNRGFVSNYEWI